MPRHSRYAQPVYLTDAPQQPQFQIRGPIGLVVGIPYLAGRAAYKAYKKHQAEKNARERGVAPPVVDPSNAITELSSSSSHTDAEMERALENDVDFQRFIQRQKQVYLNQYRGVSELPGGGSPSVGVPVASELPALPPPAYDDVMGMSVPQEKRAVAVPAAPESRSRSRSQQVPVTPEEEDEQDGDLVSPSSLRDGSRPGELDGAEVSPISPTRGSLEVVAELPGSSRPPVEMPVS